MKTINNNTRKNKIRKSRPVNTKIKKNSAKKTKNTFDANRRITERGGSVQRVKTPSRKSSYPDYRYMSRQKSRLTTNDFHSSFSENDLKRLGIETERLTKQIERRKNRELEKAADKNSFSGKLVAFIAFLAVFIYLGSSSLNFITSETLSFDTVQYGSIDEPKSAVGIIIRDETVYTAPADGIISYNVADNSRVKKGTSVCSIKNEAAVSDVQENLDKLNESILDIQKNREDMSWFTDDIKRVNSQIKDLIDENIYNFSISDIHSVYALKESIKNKLDTRNQMLLSENRGPLTELVEKKNAEEEKLSKNMVSLTALNGGIVSYYTDGLENTFNISGLEGFTKEQTLMDLSTIESKTSVKSSEPVFRLVNSNIWYIASYIQNEYIENWEEGLTVTIFPENNQIDESLEAKIKKIVTPKDESESYVILEVSKNIVDYINTRSITFEITKSKIGYKIPNSSIVNLTILKIPAEYIEENTVHKVTDTGIVSLPITNSGTDEAGKFIYTPETEGILKIGDTIRNPNDLNQTYVITEVINQNGVYVINSGIAEFKTINTENSYHNSTHTIIMPEVNNQIRLYDRIVTDTSSITDEEKVFK